MPRTKQHHNTPTTPHEGAQPPRVRPALRKAVDLIVWKGKTQRDAAAEAGMNECALARALAKPHVRQWLEHLKAQAAIDADQLKAQARTIAIREGIDLMTTAKSEAVRAKLVEFFAGEARAGTSVNVNIDARAGGYEFVRPGQKLVDVTPAKPKAD